MNSVVIFTLAGMCRVGGGTVGHLTFRLNLVQARKMLKAMELTEGWARPWGLCTQSLELQK